MWQKTVKKIAERAIESGLSSLYALESKRRLSGDNSIEFELFCESMRSVGVEFFTDMMRLKDWQLAASYDLYYGSSYH